MPSAPCWGERTSRDLIRTGEKSALVTALFQNLPNLPWFQENGVGPDENGELVISRKIQGDGKNLCRVGGVPCTVLQLKALGAQLIDIHGQHDGQQLLDETCHLGYLDSFGGLEEVREAYREEYDRLDHIRRQIASCKWTRRKKPGALIPSISDCGTGARQPPTRREEEELEERKGILRGADQLMDAVGAAYYAVFGTDSQSGAASLLAEAESALSRVAALSGELSQLSSAVSELRYTTEDVAERLRDVRESLDFSPQELDAVESRLDHLHRLKKKYGGSVSEMLEYLARCQNELDQIEMADDSLAKLKQQRKEQLAKTRAQGEALSKSAGRRRRR